MVIAFLFALCAFARAEEVPAPSEERVSASWDEIHAYEYPRAKMAALMSLGAPHPLNLDLLTQLSPQADVVVGGGYLPYSPSSGKVISMLNFDVGARWHPFEGPFFAGLFAGFQRFQFSTPVKLGPSNDDFKPTGVLGLNTLYVNPQIGFQWRLGQSWLIGIDAGLQIPIYGWGGIKSTGYDPSNADLAASFEADSHRAAAHFSSLKLPQVALVRLGWIFRE